MGCIKIDVMGSFRQNESKVFSAMEYGHAQAVSDAIKYLSDEVLPKAIINDHECHADGIKPTLGYGRK